MFYFARTFCPSKWLLFQFCFFKILSPILKLLSSMCLIMELPGINRLSLLSTWQDLLEYLEWSRSVCKLRLRLICHVPQALSTWLVSIDLPVKRRGKKKTHFNGQGGNQEQLLVMKIIEFLRWVQHFIFWHSQLLPLRSPAKFPPVRWETAYNHPLRNRLQTLCPLFHGMVHVVETLKVVALLLKYFSGTCTLILCWVKSVTQEIVTNYCINMSIH